MVQASTSENSRPTPRPRVDRVRRTERRRAAPEAWARILFLSPHQLLILFLVTLVLPINFTLGGLQLPPYTCALLIFIVPTFLYWLQHAPRLIFLDLCMLLYVLWIALALYHTHGKSQLVFIVSQLLTQFGAYVLGRVLIRDAASYRLMFVCFFWILLALLPFALIELVFRRSIPAMIFGLPWPVGRGLERPRLGLRRVTSVFPHPILFGVFCSMMVANFFYVFHERTRTRFSRTLLASAMTLMSLSTGPNLSQIIQIILIAWERLFRFFVTKWYVLVVAAGTLLGVFQLGYPGGFYGFIVDYLTFNPVSGAGRMEILFYGSRAVAQHPIFGIGLTPWNGAWWRPYSVDNFWLVIAMRYGLPALGFIWVGIGWHMVRVLGARGLTEQAANYRKGYAFVAVGTIFVLASVHVWATLGILVIFYFGAGAWFYLGDATPEPVQPRERRSPPSTPAIPAASRSSGAGRVSLRRAPARQDFPR